LINDEPSISSLADLISKIVKDTKSLNEPIWYRGHANSSWDLLPYIQRNYSYLKPELEYLRQFKQHATLLANPKPSNSVEWLFLMRHYGVPTRLLDWTESPLTAAYFAVNNDKEEESDGLIWILRPVKMNQNIGSQEKRKTLPSFDEDVLLMEDFKPPDEEHEPSKNADPIAFLATRNSQRMQAQLSVFTINAEKSTKINEVGKKDHSWKYIISHDVKNQIKEELKLIGINRFQLFPELENINKKFEEY